MLLLVVLTISSVSATDNLTDEEVLQENPSDEIELSEDVNDEIVSSSQQNIISEKDDGTFTALQKKINNAALGSTITLENDYTYDEGFDTNGIEIFRSIVIDGNGHTLNGLSKSRILDITGGGNIGIKNIKFINGYTPGEGGAILSYGNNLDITNCIFENNHADEFGGAIEISYYLEGTTRPYTKKGGFYTTISNCEFNNNYARVSGGGIQWSGDYGTLDSCTFKYNYVTVYGGDAVYWEGENGVISNCKSYTAKSKEDNLYVYKNNANVKGFDIIVVKSNSQQSKTTKETPKLTAKKATFKVKQKIKKYTATLKTNKNNVMKNIKLYLKVKGKTIIAKTNNNGKATFKIKNLKKEHIVQLSPSKETAITIKLSKQLKLKLNKDLTPYFSLSFFKINYINN